MNFDYKVILLNTLCTLYFIFKYEFNIIIPIISLVCFNFLKQINHYYNYIEYSNFEKENKIGYEIYENNKCYSLSLLLVITLLTITNMYELQIFITILLIYIKIENYEYVRLMDYYLVDFKLTQTILFSTFLLMCHYSQILKNDFENISKIIIFISQNLLYTIDYDINVVN
jgi:hypothetical protein